MHSSKKNIEILVATLLSYNIRHIVLSPGSRNAPIIQTFLAEKEFTSYQITDERSAAFFALGIIDAKQEPVAICCTSGTALLEYGPAIAEAYYRKLPLIVISADRPEAWIGQMDGQTIQQNNIFKSITSKSITLIEPQSKEDYWYCQRLMHEIMFAIKQFHMPVHINIPLSEPLFDFKTSALTEIAPIDFLLPDEKKDFLSKSGCLDIWEKSKKRMIIVGQQCFGENLEGLTKLLYSLASSNQCIILAEHLANLTSIEEFISSDFDARIYSILNLNENKANANVVLDDAVPDLVIYVGGHIVSKRLKEFIRRQKPKHIWRIDPEAIFSDVFQRITKFIVIPPLNFLQFFEKAKISFKSCEQNFIDFWLSDKKAFIPDLEKIQFSDLFVTGSFFRALANNSSLLKEYAIYLSNSSVIRNAQFFHLNNEVSIFCNRGTNGIDGVISTASGHAMALQKTTFLIVGDLSFFYDIGFLAEDNAPKHLKILLINNGGGGIFDQLPMPKSNIAYQRFVAATNSRRAQDWLSDDKIEYFSAINKEEFQEKIKTFVQMKSKKIVLFEVFTDREINSHVLKSYYQNL